MTRCLTKGLQFDLSVMESEDDEEIEPVKQPQPKQRKPRKKADAPRQAPKVSPRNKIFLISKLQTARALYFLSTEEQEARLLCFVR